MAFIFASDPNSLASSRMGYDQLNVNLAEKDRAARQQAIDQQNQNYVLAQQQARKDAEEQAQRQYQFASLSANQQQSAASADTQKFQFNAEEADKKAQREQGAYQFGESQKLKSKELDANQAYGDFQSVMNGIQTGDITDPTDISTHDKLTPEQKASALSHLATVTAKHAQDYQGLAGVAKGATLAVKPTGFFSRFQTLSEADAMDRLAFDPTYRRLAEKLVWNEAAQQFEPNLTPPKSSVAPASPVNSLSLGNAVPVPVDNPGYGFAMPQPAATAPAPAPFGNRGAMAQTNAPVTQMSNGYRVNAVYRGMQYLGGDPNNPASWRQVR